MEFLDFGEIFQGAERASNSGSEMSVHSNIISSGARSDKMSLVSVSDETKPNCYCIIGNM